MNRLILTIAATIACLTSAGETLHSQEKPNNKSPQDFHRQIFVPLENLDVLLDGNSNRVLLSRDEYDALLKQPKHVKSNVRRWTAQFCQQTTLAKFLKAWG